MTDNEKITFLATSTGSKQFQDGDWKITFAADMSQSEAAKRLWDLIGESLLKITVERVEEQ